MSLLDLSLLDSSSAPLYYVISAVLVGWHRLLTDGLGLDATGGLAWVLSIVGLTLVVRAALIPLFVRQLRSMRELQRLQPRIRELQRLHGHDRERLGQETMRLYRESGTNPFASCLPLLVQAPVFLVLFRLLDRAAKAGVGHGLLTDALATQLGQARLLGQLPIAASFLHPGGLVAVQVVAVVLVVATAVATLVAQRQQVYAPQQPLLVYAVPAAFALTGLAFPIGVLCYWTTSSLWTLGQQWYVGISLGRGRG